MKTKETKIQFLTLIKRNWATQNQRPIDEPFHLVDQVLEYTYKLPKADRFYSLKNDKFCFIDHLQIDGNFITGCFKSARNQFRPNLIDRRTGKERKNPKEKTEGDIEKTHFIIKLDKDQDEAYLFLESNFDGISINNFVNYLKEFSKKHAEKNKLGLRFSIIYSIIPRNNFLTELDKLSRTKIAEVHVDKRILGNDFLNYSNRTVSVQHDVMFKLKAERQQDIRAVVVDLFNKFSGKKDNSINKIRIYGIDQEGNDAVVDTSFMGLVEYVSAKVDTDTGDLNTPEFLGELRKIANFF